MTCLGMLNQNLIQMVKTSSVMRTRCSFYYPVSNISSWLLSLAWDHPIVNRFGQMVCETAIMSRHEAYIIIFFRSTTTHIGSIGDADSMVCHIPFKLGTWMARIGSHSFWFPHIPGYFGSCQSGYQLHLRKVFLFTLSRLAGKHIQESERKSSIWLCPLIQAPQEDIQTCDARDGYCRLMIYTAIRILKFFYTLFQ